MKKQLEKNKNNFKENTALIERISKEKINGKTFGELFNNREDYLSIIKIWGGGIIFWKKTNFLENLKEKVIFHYRRRKSKERKKEYLKHTINKNQIVFFPISETQTMVIEPIIKNLLRGEEHPYVLRFDYSLNGLKKELEKSSIPYINFDYFLSKGVIKSIKKIRKEFNWVLPAYKNISRKNKDYSRLNIFFNYYFGNRNRFYEVVEFMEAFKIFLVKMKPSLVFLADDCNDIPRAVSYLCKKMGIPCIAIQHGIINSEGLIINDAFVTKKLVFEKFSKKILRTGDLPAKDIEVVGNPLYDNLKLDKLKLRKDMGIQDKEKVIVFDSADTDTKEFEEKFVYLIQTIKKHSNLKLIIKQHPSEYNSNKYKKLYTKIAKKYDLPVIISQGKMSDVLNISEVFITRISTTIIEALALGVPTILLNTGAKPNYECFPESERVLEHVEKLEDFEKILMKILESKDTKFIIKNRKKILERNAGKIDGKATERIIKIINKLKLK